MVHPGTQDRPVSTPKSAACTHCKNGWFDGRYGEDVECVNGVLIDIDVAHEGWETDLSYPVAPCHPQWEEQAAAYEAGDDISTDCQERLHEWAGTPYPLQNALKPDDGASMRHDGGLRDEHPSSIATQDRGTSREEQGDA